MAAMNRYVKAGMELAVAQRELGTLLDTPAEKRESDFDGKLASEYRQGSVVQAAQSAVEVAASGGAERPGTPAGQPARAPNCVRDAGRRPT